MPITSQQVFTNAVGFDPFFRIYRYSENIQTDGSLISIDTVRLTFSFHFKHFWSSHSHVDQMDSSRPDSAQKPSTALWTIIRFTVDKYALEIQRKINCSLD